NLRTFWPLKKCVEDDETKTLPDNGSLSHSITLLRGSQKALFPMAGIHQIRVTAIWQRDGKRVFAEGRTSVQITPAADDLHRAAAFKILATPDTLLSLAIGGDHLVEGNNAVRAAIGNPILRRHFAVVEAKRLLSRDPEGTDPITKEAPRYAEACKLVDDD